jgi:hypothetical protein
MILYIDFGLDGILRKDAFYEGLERFKDKTASR